MHLVIAYPKRGLYSLSEFWMHKFQILVMKCGGKRECLLKMLVLFQSFYDVVAELGFYGWRGFSFV